MARRLPCVKTKVKYVTCDIDLFQRKYVMQKIAVPQRFEHFAMMEGVLLRNMIDHLDYESILNRYSKLFERTYLDVYRELNERIAPFQTEAIIDILGLTHILPLFQQGEKKLDSLIEASKAEKDSYKKSNNQYIEGSLVVQYIRELGLEKREQCGVNKHVYEKIITIFP